MDKMQAQQNAATLMRTYHGIEYGEQEVVVYRNDTLSDYRLEDSAGKNVTDIEDAAKVIHSITRDTLDFYVNKHREITGVDFGAEDTWSALAECIFPRN